MGLSCPTRTSSRSSSENCTHALAVLYDRHSCVRRPCRRVATAGIASEVVQEDSWRSTGPRPPLAGWLADHRPQSSEHRSSPAAGRQRRATFSSFGAEADATMVEWLTAWLSWWNRLAGAGTGARVGQQGDGGREIDNGDGVAVFLIELMLSSCVCRGTTQVEIASRGRWTGQDADVVVVVVSGELSAGVAGGARCCAVLGCGSDALRCMHTGEPLALVHLKCSRSAPRSGSQICASHCH